MIPDRRACAGGIPHERFVAPAGLLFLLALLMVWPAGCAKRRTAPSTAERAQVGAFRVAAENHPSRPAVGDNRLDISVEDSSGRPVSGATIEMSVVMEAMGVMPRMQSRGAVRESRPGHYEAKYGLGMGGEWALNLAIRGPDGSQAVASWRLSTSTDRLTFAAGTPPTGSAPPAGAPSAGGIDAGTDIPGFGPVMLDPSRRQSIGVRTAVATARPLRATIRAAGKVAYDETRRAEISLKFSGWVRQIYVDYTGRVVRKGEPLFSVYSPELFSAQQEFLEALRAPGSGGSGAVGADPELAAAARQRLRLWDITPAQIDAIAESGKPLEAVPIVAPVSGVVVEKNVVQGTSLMAGQLLYRIAAIDPVWVVASVYQYELPLVRTGMGAVVETPFLPERTRTGRVSYVNPYLDPGTRTGEVRLTVPNPRGDMKPGMFVDVTLEKDLGTRLAIPLSSVLYEGDRRIVFVDLGSGGIVPREVALGAKAGDEVEVESGLRVGDVVVTSGNFLIAAESKLQAAGVNP
ncbi:MAG TPA: efflux RND transporter periplasmic adaptor subunit [Candidatus Limnocylindrales bacterium]|nr:efflux RND transporter periplasmic adaptor subunit [Candidatus Limnocylindrales bacterium]